MGGVRPKAGAALSRQRAQSRHRQIQLQSGACGIDLDPARRGDGHRARSEHLEGTISSDQAGRLVQSDHRQTFHLGEERPVPTRHAQPVEVGSHDMAAEEAETGDEPERVRRVEIEPPFEHGDGPRR